jgi:hypothetical protein
MAGMLTRWKCCLQSQLVILLLVILSEQISALQDVIYAVNAGGEGHVDVNGVKFERDPLSGKVGTASDFGKQLLIGRVHQHDHILYQTERYHHSTFGYDIPIKEDGDYVLILKFCEVYFRHPNAKVCSSRVVQTFSLSLLPHPFQLDCIRNYELALEIFAGNLLAL